MNDSVACSSLEEVRTNIDAIDRQIVALIAQRGGFVAQAAHFKQSTTDVRAPQRVEQVVAKARTLARELGANADVIEAVYRAMISAFIEAELAEFKSLRSTEANNLGR